MTTQTPRMMTAAARCDEALDNLLHGCPELHGAAYRQALDEYRAAELEARKQQYPDECGCVLPEQTCPACQATARRVYADEI